MRLRREPIPTVSESIAMRSEATFREPDRRDRITHRAYEEMGRELHEQQHWRSPAL